MKRLVLFLFIILSFNAAAKKYDIVVSSDGSGNFRTVQEAINSVRDFRPEGRTTIFIKKGVYKEKIVLPTWKTELTLVGESRDSTIITWDDHANINRMGTFRSYTFFVGGNDIVFSNLTIQNNAPQLGQAVALHVEGDRILFVNCNLLGNQDTIYLGREGSRAYFLNCYIEGTTDFIFGPSTAWFEGCTILEKRNSYLTAASTPKNIKYGFIFENCTVEAAPGVTELYLGRPWRRYAMTLFRNCNLPKEVKPAGWHNWGDPEREKTARYSEYRNYGPGFVTEARAAWSRQLTKKESGKITLSNVFNDWCPKETLNQLYDTK